MYQDQVRVHASLGGVPQKKNKHFRKFHQKRPGERHHTKAYNRAPGFVKQLPFAFGSDPTRGQTQQAVEATKNRLQFKKKLARKIMKGNRARQKLINFHNANTRQAASQALIQISEMLRKSAIPRQKRIADMSFAQLEQQAQIAEGAFQPPERRRAPSGMAMRTPALRRSR